MYNTAFCEFQTFVEMSIDNNLAEKLTAPNITNWAKKRLAITLYNWSLF